MIVVVIKNYCHDEEFVVVEIWVMINLFGHCWAVLVRGGGAVCASLLLLLLCSMMPWFFSVTWCYVVL